MTFSCKVALAKVSSTIVNVSGESVHTCFLPGFRGNAFSLSPFSMMLTEFVHSLLSLLFLVYSELLSWRDVEFYQRFFLHRASILDSTSMLYYIYWFVYVESSLHSWNESNLNMICDLFIVLLILIHKYFTEDFLHLCSSRILVCSFVVWLVVCVCMCVCVSLLGFDISDTGFIE
jgi:hypothetical protein